MPYFTIFEQRKQSYFTNFTVKAPSKIKNYLSSPSFGNAFTNFIS